MSLTKIGSIGINTGIQFAGVTTVSTLHVGSGVTLSSDGDVFATGISTFSEDIKVGSGVTISPDGDGFFTGVITATSYSGIDLSDVTGATGDFSIADKIVHTGDTNTALRFPADDTITAETTGSERARIDSSGRVLIGTTTEGHDDADNLTIADSANAGVTIRSGTGNAGHIYFSDGTSGTDEYKGLIAYNQASDYFTFWTNGDGEKLRIDSSGRVLIGTTTEGQEDADDLTIESSGSCGITLRSGTSAAGAIYFSDATSGTAEYDGAIIYNQSSQFMSIYTAQSPRIRIDSNGRVGVNTAVMSNANAGFDDLVVRGSDGGNSGITILSGTTSAQGTVAFADGTNGNETYAAYVQYQHNTNKLVLGAAAADQLTIDDGNVTLLDCDLVMSNGRGMSFAATANTSGTSSELLDDYEEGTWTPTASESGNNVALSNNTGRYVKIGAMVYATWRINVDSTSAGGHFILSGLPFTTINVNPAAGGVAKDYQTYDIENGPIYHVPNNSSQVQFYKNSGQNLNANNASGYDFRATVIYQAGQIN